MAFPRAGFAPSRKLLMDISGSELPGGSHGSTASVSWFTPASTHRQSPTRISAPLRLRATDLYGLRPTAADYCITATAAFARTVPGTDWPTSLLGRYSKTATANSGRGPIA